MRRIESSGNRVAAVAFAGAGLSLREDRGRHPGHRPHGRVRAGFCPPGSLAAGNILAVNLPAIVSRFFAMHLAFAAAGDMRAVHRESSAAG